MIDNSHMSLYGLIIGICLAIGSWYFSRRNTIIPKNREDFFIIGTIISALIGARTYHVIDQWSYYSQDLIQILNTRAGGLGIYGGLLGGLIFIIIYSWKAKINLIKLLDNITTILPLDQAIGRVGNWVNHENPIWWQEAILDLTLFFILLKIPKHFSPTALYLIGYGLIRFVTEFYRTDTWVYSGIKVAHIISLISIFSGLCILLYNYRRPRIQNKSL